MSSPEHLQLDRVAALANDFAVDDSYSYPSSEVAEMIRAALAGEVDTRGARGPQLQPAKPYPGHSLWIHGCGHVEPWTANPDAGDIRDQGCDACEGGPDGTWRQLFVLAGGRPWTPPQRSDDDQRTTSAVKRACNGCGELLGDATDAEMERAIAGLPPDDVREECARCSAVVITGE